ncbi:hypothetical protein FRC06_003329 [Ceratobasidium sp. 370]|nr:hypothetical protein FRC06_003329 [Ceratobasidium sp. 370]
MSDISDPPPPYERYDSTDPGPRPSISASLEISYETENTPEDSQDDHHILDPVILLQLSQSPQTESDASSEESRSGVDADDEWSPSQTVFSGSVLSSGHVRYRADVFATLNLHDCTDCVGYDSCGDSICSFDDDFGRDGVPSTERTGMEGIVRGALDDILLCDSQGKEEGVEDDGDISSPMSLDVFIQ